MNIDKRIDESLFYCDSGIEINENTKMFIDPLKAYSVKESKQVYILKKALGVKKVYEYNLSDIAVILIPKHPIIILNYGNENEDDFEDYKLDFMEDLGHLADKYEYSKILGRTRKWPPELIEKIDRASFDVQSHIKREIDEKYQRKVDLLISLLIGSINSIDNIGLNEPDTLLDKVKQKIILFDGKQSKFIYEQDTKDKVIIQGMAGTGKTELLLHKLKDVYANNEDTRIAFTCFNKVLANYMKIRIPKFFNFMKVDEQIEWGNRLHVFSSWGSFSQPESGMYSYICHKYGLPFKSYNENKNFDELCEEAIESLNEKEIVDPCFDYIFIDESQDFGEKFFELCGKICKVTVYIAGDIFQNIFDANINMEVEPTYLLNKCYRTDPKTLMFAHAVGMGLYEEHPINWLEDTEWGFCGYTYERKPLEFRLSRSPLRRFEDLNATNTIRLLACANDNCCEKVLSCINTIKSENKSVQAEDIAIIILAKYRTLCSIADNIEFELYNQYKWESSKGYETKEKKPDKVYISNINNIKGLEFPFIICVVPGIVSDNIKYRNSIYMALTRSFLTSYFIVGSGNEEFINIYQKAIIDITQHGAMLLKEPSEEEKQRMASKIQITLETQKRSLSEILDELFTLEYPKLSKESRELVNDTLTKISKHWTEKQICKKAQAFIEEVLEGE